MTIIYRGPGPWGAGQGSNLTAAQIDGNIYDLDQRVTALEDNPATAVSIDYFVLTGDQLVIHMTDHSIRGPFTVPTANWQWRGDWQADTFYFKLDVFSHNGAIYLVLRDHLSPHVFDAGFNLGSGLDCYALMLEQPADMLPSGGSVGQALTKRTNADFAVEWSDIAGLPPHGLTGQVLMKHSGADFDAFWVSLAFAHLSDVALSTLADGEMLEWSVALGSWINIAKVWHPIEQQINETDLLAHTTQYLIAPFDGFIEEFHYVVQKTVTTGGNIAVKINGSTVTGLSAVAVANGATAGTHGSTAASGANTIVAGDVISLVLSSFATAGALKSMIRCRPKS